MNGSNGEGLSIGCSRPKASRLIIAKARRTQWLCEIPLGCQGTGTQEQRGFRVTLSTQVDKSSLLIVSATILASRNRSQDTREQKEMVPFQMICLPLTLTPNANKIWIKDYPIFKKKGVRASLSLAVQVWTEPWVSLHPTLYICKAGWEIPADPASKNWDGKTHRCTGARAPLLVPRAPASSHSFTRTCSHSFTRTCLLDARSMRGTSATRVDKLSGLAEWDSGKIKYIWNTGG